MLKNIISIACLSGVIFSSSLYAGNLTVSNNVQLDTLKSMNAKDVIKKAQTDGYQVAGSMITGLSDRSRRRSALSVAAQAGFNDEAKRITKIINLNYETLLDRVFNFRSLMIQQRIVPAVISQYDRVSVKDGNSIHQTDKVFKIISPAKITMRPPTWRNYLVLSQQTIILPDPQIMPKNSTEQKQWNKWLEQGWKSGVEQANMGFDLAMATLMRDYIGMMTYRVLYNLGMITDPKLSNHSRGIVIKDNELRIDDQIWSLRLKSKFKPVDQYLVLLRELSDVTRN